MKHLFVPYEIALLLKQKGFDEPCFYHWERGTDEHGWGLFTSCDWRQSKDLIESYHDEDGNLCGEFSSPLYQQVVDWFREEHKIVIEVAYSGSVDNYQPKFIRLRKSSWIFIPNTYKDYYEALTEAILHAITLLP